MTKPKPVGCPYHSVREDPGSPNKAGTVGVSSPFHSFRDEDSSQLRAGLTDWPHDPEAEALALVTGGAEGT